MDHRVFVKAAKLVKKERFACHAVSRATAGRFGDDNTEYHTGLVSIFRPRDWSDEAWFTEKNDCDETHSSSPKGQLRRELALLFLAEMVKSGDLK